MPESIVLAGGIIIPCVNVHGLDDFIVAAKISSVEELYLSRAVPAEWISLKKKKTYPASAPPDPESELGISIISFVQVSSGLCSCMRA